MPVIWVRLKRQPMTGEHLRNRTQTVFQTGVMFSTFAGRFAFWFYLRPSA